MTTTPIVPSPLASPVLLRRCATKADPPHGSAPPLFPWRHETAEHPLPRLVPGTPESQYHENVPSEIEDGIASLTLNVPLWHRLMGRDWRPVFAESASYAFSKGVAGIVSNVYRIPFNDLLTEEEASSGMRQTLDFRYPMSPPASPIAPNVEIERSDAPSSPSPPDNATGVTGNPANDRDDDGDSSPPPDAFCPGVDQMLDHPLRKLFQSANEDGKNRLQIRLQTTPTSQCEVVSLFALPFLSRQVAERYPSLVRQARELTWSKSNIHTVAKHVEEVTDEDQQNHTTVELQVLVECDEIFQVVDRETGHVLQGSADGAMRRVSHLLRLETMSTMAPSATFPYFLQVEFDNWIITDIDDLLGPKKWYHC